MGAFDPGCWVEAFSLDNQASMSTSSSVVAPGWLQREALISGVGRLTLVAVAPLSFQAYPAVFGTSD